MSLGQQNIAVLAQARDLLAQLDPAHLEPSGSTSGVGAHLRHCFDAYRCFLRGLDADGLIDYDARERDVEVERDPNIALARVDELVCALDALSVDAANQPVRVRHDAAAWEHADPWSQSTVARELQFLLSHTIHHYALIAHLLAVRGVEVDATFGVAPSTLEYRSAVATCAQ
ncbi:MAG: DinB family protein [Acidobacteriota bacterium]